MFFAVLSISSLTWFRWDQSFLHVAVSTQDHLSRSSPRGHAPIDRVMHYCDFTSTQSVHCVCALR